LISSADSKLGEVATIAMNILIFRKSIESMHVL